jgi:hypothetical protein
MTIPLEAFTIAPVRVRAPSEARKAASRAVSATVGQSAFIYTTNRHDPKRTSFQQWSGHEVDIQGDAFLTSW